jgi:phosphoglycerate dehydrogenase-like enzyme
MRILLYPRLAEEGLQLAHSLLPPGFEMEVIGPEAKDSDLIKALASVSVMMGFIRRSLPAHVVSAMRHLKLIQLLSAGYDKVDVAAMREFRVLVATNGGANSVAVAEHAIMLMLAVYRRLFGLCTEVKSWKWPSAVTSSQRLYELEGKTVGLVGLGSIGREVAKRIRGFGASMMYYDVARLDAAIEESLGVQYVGFSELLRRVDILSLHVPLSPETHHMVGVDELRAMKRSAVLINTCRGGVVDEEALYGALREGIIAGAGLDTLEQEPPPINYPLVSLPNVTITPHSAGPTVESWPKRIRNAYANIQRVAVGQLPLWVIPELSDLVGQ